MKFYDNVMEFKEMMESDKSEILEHYPQLAYAWENYIKDLEEILKSGKPHFHCPVNGYDCPYYTNTPQNCMCTLENPMEECDDFYSAWGDDCDPEDYTDYDLVED